jgi:hypothetical protein
MEFKILKKKIHEPKVSRLLPNVCDLQKENHTLGYGSKENPWPSLWIFILCDYHLWIWNRNTEKAGTVSEHN